MIAHHPQFRIQGKQTVTRVLPEKVHRRLRVKSNPTGGKTSGIAGHPVLRSIRKIIPMHQTRGRAPALQLESQEGVADTDWGREDLAHLFWLHHNEPPLQSWRLHLNLALISRRCFLHPGAMLPGFLYLDPESTLADVRIFVEAEHTEMGSCTPYTVTEHGDVAASLRLGSLHSGLEEVPRQRLLELIGAATLVPMKIAVKYDTLRLGKLTDHYITCFLSRDDKMSPRWTLTVSDPNAPEEERAYASYTVLLRRGLLPVLKMLHAILAHQVQLVVVRGLNVNVCIGQKVFKTGVHGICWSGLCFMLLTMLFSRRKFSSGAKAVDFMVAASDYLVMQKLATRYLLIVLNSDDGAHDELRAFIREHVLDLP